MNEAESIPITKGLDYRSSDSRGSTVVHIVTPMSGTPPFMLFSDSSGCPWSKAQLLRYIALMKGVTDISMKHKGTTWVLSV